MEIFSILIPSWNNLPYLKMCIDSIKKNSTYKHQIIVHINEGKDGSLDWVKKEGLDYTYSENNIGVCLSLNLARTKASTDYICYINDDMYMLPRWDEFFYNEIEKLNGNKLFFLSGSIIQPHLLPPEGSGMIANYGERLDNFKETELLNDCERLFIDDWYGATAPPNILHKDLWDIVGGYSIEFSPGMGSDPDFTCKLLMIGVTYLKGIGQMMAYHFGSKSTTRIKRNKPGAQMLFKWELPHSTVRLKFIRMGQPWKDTYLSEPNSKYLYLEGVRGKFKGIYYLIRSLFKKEKIYSIPKIKLGL